MTTPATRRRRAGFAAVLLAGSTLGGLAFWSGPGAHAEAQPLSPPAVTIPGAPQGFADLVARVRPAVVTVATTERAAATEAASPFAPGSEQDRMLRRFFGEGGAQPQQPRAAQGLGSGFLIDAAGHIVTNNHVVQGASAVRITLEDGRELPARVVGRDPRTDLALLKVEAGAPLPFLALGDSDRARPGDWVVALGNPFGLGGTVTAGVVSARSRDIGAGPYDDFIQVDAPINRGNSGGPLFSTAGEVIGVNTAIFSPNGGSVGIGFAIPSNMVKSVVAQLKENGHVERGFLGAATQPVTPALAEALRLPAPSGALVSQVEEGSPAQRAGLKPGDVVTAVGDTAVASPRELARAIGEARPGSTVALSVRRDGATQELSVTLAELRDGRQQAAAEPRQEGRASIGVSLAPLTDPARAQLGLPRGARGAVVAEVRPGSPAEHAGLRPGDVVTAVGGQDVADAEGAAKAIRAATREPGAAVALRILRDGRSAFVAVEAPAVRG
jgi:serine protease Do